MQPLSSLSQEKIQNIKAILFDLDDTFLTHGQITHEAYHALCALAEAGYALFVVTGRPAGWAEVLAYQWPIHGVVAENGGVVLWKENARIHRVIASKLSAYEIRQQLNQWVICLQHEFPNLPLVDDSYLRLTDCTFDIGENWTAPQSMIACAQQKIAQLGAHSFTSSIHLHLSCLGDTKISGALRLLSLREGFDAAEARVRSVFIGDSLNDASCFSFFNTTVGVANVQPYLKGLSVSPKYITQHRYGAGFHEFAQRFVDCTNAS